MALFYRHSFIFTHQIPGIWLIATLIVLLVGNMELRGQSQPLMPEPSFIVDNWGMEDGLPVNNVVKILQSRDGYLWMATLDGLVRFDGIRFKVYQSDTYPDLPTNRLINLVEANDGSLWMDTEQRFLVRYKDGEFRHIGPEDGLNGISVLNLWRGPDGLVWIGSNNGLSVYDGNRLSLYRPDLIQGRIDRIFVQENGVVWYRDQNTLNLYRVEDGEQRRIFTSTNTLNFLPIFEDDAGLVWIGDGPDIYRFEQDTLQHFGRLDASGQEVISIGCDQHGTVWAASYGNGFYELSDDGIEHFEPSRNEGYAFLSAFHVDDQEQFWKFSNQSVWLMGEKILDVDSGINFYTFDNEGNLWLATTNRGLIRIKQNPFETFGVAEGLPNENIYPVLEARNGTIWLGTHGGGVGRIIDGVAEPGPPIEEADLQAYVWSLYQKSDGTILAGLLGSGLYELNPGDQHFTKIPEPSELSSASVIAIYEQQNGILMLGTNRGLFIQDENEWEQFNRASGFTDHTVRYFLDAPDGSLWMATNGAGIVRYHNGNFDIFGINEGFGSNLVRSLYIRPGSDAEQYVLWVGTEDQGLIRLEVENGDPNFSTMTRYSRGIGMLDFVIHVILEDDLGNFWFNTNRGIFAVEYEDLEAYHRGEINSISGDEFTENDGLRNREGNGGVFQPGIKASDGRFWFAGQAGIAVIDPFRLNTNDQQPQVKIEELETGFRSIENLTEEGVRLEVNERDFEIRFTSLSLQNPDKNEFRYRLAGFNDSWIESGGRRSVAYTNIPAGSYIFEVMGSNNTGTWNPEPATLALVVAPYFYETGWFRLIMLGLLGLVFYGGVQWRVRSLEKNRLKLENLVDERTELLRQEKQKTQELVEQLQEQADRLEELDRAKTRFFTNISHEFRTPLTLIISPLQRMLAAGKEHYSTESLQEFERMLRNSDRLVRLIDQTLELSRLEHGKIKLEVGELDLVNFVNTITGLFEPVCHEKGLELSFENGIEKENCYADPDKLEKIIANLLSNAVKFTPSGGNVTVSLGDIGEYTEVRVTDTGIGIPPEELEKIFDRFYQVDSSETRFHEGSGVGLSLARNLARLHHGDLLVHSEQGEGTTFVLQLRKGKEHFKPKELTSNEISFDPSPVEMSAMKQHDIDESTHDEEDGDEDDLDVTTVMIVEDNDDMRSFIRETLENEWRVTEAANGKEALAGISEGLPDLVIADIMMPEMDGITFNKELKKDLSTASIPLIFLTAKATKDDQISGFDEGADDYITKPFDPELLKARVRNLIESRYRLRELQQAEHGREKLSEYRNPGHPFLVQVNEILEENFNDPDFNVTELVAQLYLDRSQAHRKLKELSGMSLSAYIKKYRMDAAAALFNHHAGSVSEVAYAVGFKSLSHFSHVFKEYFGKTPSEYME